MKKFKPVLSMLLVVCMIMGMVPSAQAATIVASGTCGSPFKENVTWALDSNGLLTLTGTGNTWSYTYNGAPWYGYRSDIKAVEIDSRITGIGNGFFGDCENLELTELPSGIKTIGGQAFYNCKKITLTKLPDSIKKLNYQAFFGCTSLALTELPKELVSIGDDVFTNCSSLALTELPAGITLIGGGAFNGCTNIPQLLLPDKIQSIGSTAFSRCSKLANFGFLDNDYFKVYDSRYLVNKSTNELIAFAPGGTSIADIPQCVQKIGDGVFSLCTNLTQVLFPHGLESIGNSSFVYCNNLGKIELPDGIESIGRYAFYDCTKLKLSKLPVSLTDIPSNAFGNCINLELTELPEGITSIGYAAFSNCRKLALTKLPDTVTSIGGVAFSDCTNMPLEYISNNVTSIGDGAFSVCYRINEIHMRGATNSVSGAPWGVSSGKVLWNAKRIMLDWGVPGQPQKKIWIDGTKGLVAVPTDAPTKPGYNFEAFYKEEALSNKYSWKNPIDDDCTLFAAWTPRTDTTYHVEHYTQDVTGGGYTLRDTDNLTGTTDATVTASAKTYTGFAEHTTHADRVPSGSMAPDGSLVLKLYYDRDLHSVTFDSKGGSSVATQTGIRFEGAATEPTPPIKTGYDFGGWWADEDCTVAFDFATPITSDVTACASWTARSDTAYKVEHYQQDVTGTGYSLKDTDQLTGTTDTTATASAKAYPSFTENSTHADRIPSGSIAPDGSTVLRLYYDRNLHSVTFNSKGGSSVTAQTGIRFEGAATEPTPPTKTGYDFGGWWADEDCTVAFDFAVPVTVDMTAYASWMARSDTAYRVEHHAQDVTGAGYTLRDTDNLTGTTDTTATASAKTYTGFHELTTHADRIPSGSVAPDGSTVLRLYYDRNLHSVTFNSKGGSSVAAQTGIRFEATATEPTPPSKTGYDFGGWWADEGCTVAFDFTTAITADVTAYASWTPRTDTAYKVQHYQQDVTGGGYTLRDTDELTGTTDATVTASVKTYPGFHELTTHADRVPSGSVAPDGSTVLKLYYDRDLHSVTFDSNGGSSVAAQTGIRFEGAATEPVAPSKTGYDFGSWWADEGCTVAFDFTAPIIADVTAYASWTARSDTPYRVEHYAQDVTGGGYTLRDTDQLTGTTDATATATAKTYTGYHELTTHADRVPSGSVAPDGSTVLRLYYDRDLHSVTFDSKGGSSVVAQTGIRFEATATEPTPPSKTGYDFGGWWADEDCTVTFDFTTPITADVTAYASWTPRADTAYKVEHYAQDVTGAGYTQRDTDNLTGTTDTTATASAKTYTGFTENSTHADRIPSGSVAPDGTLVLKLYYDRDLHSVTYDSNGGSSVVAQTGIRFEGAATEPTPPTKTGYNFGGWWADEGCTVAFDFAAPITADVTAYASWTPRADTAYKVEHYQQDVTGGGYTLRDTDQLTGTTDVTVTASAKTYPGFAENSTHADRVPSGSIAPDGSTVLKLYYDRNLHSVTYDSKGGSSVVAQTGIRFEGAATEPTPPTKQGYNFGGWWADEGCTVAFDFAAPITADVTAYASWISRSYTVALNPNGGTVETSSKQVKYGLPYGELPVPVWESHIFIGWYTHNDGGAKISATATMWTAEDSVLFALWADDESGVVDGDVNDQNGVPVANAKITIRAGAVDYRTTQTDANGHFTISAVKYGTYNLVVEKDARVVTSLFEMKSAQVSQSVILPNGITNSVIVVEENTPEIVVGGLDNLFEREEVYTKSDNDVVDSGGKVELRLTIAEKKREDAGDEGKELSQGASKPLNMLLEMNITKEVYATGADTPTTVEPLSELPELMTIIIPLTEEQQGRDGYTVFRSHGGTVDNISEEVNEAGEYIAVLPDRLVLYACKFSLYAVAFDVPSEGSTSYIITATAGAGGDISPKGKTYVSSGASKTFTITPDVGHRIADVLVDGKSVGAVDSYKFSRVGAKHTIEALFYCPSVEYSDLDAAKWYHADVDYVLNAGYMRGVGHGRFAPEQTMTRAEFVSVLARLRGNNLRGVTSTYEDVPKAAWYAPAVGWAQEYGVGLGYGKRRFGPGDDLTREQLAVMLYRYVGEGTAGSIESLATYTDGSSTSPWASDAVTWAVDAGLLQGNGKGRLSPSGEITRAEVAAILKRFVEM